MSRKLIYCAILICNIHTFLTIIGAIETVTVMDLQLPMQSMSITTDVVSSNLHQGEVHNIM